MYYNNSCLENQQKSTNEQIFLSRDSFEGVSRRKKSAYLTNTDKSLKKVSSTSVSVGSDFSNESLNLFRETKNLYNDDSKKSNLRFFSARGFIKFKKINNNTYYVYRSQNQTGNSHAGYNLAKDDSDSDKARLASKQLAYERCLANTDIWRYFVTITINPRKKNRFDYSARRKELSKWFQNHHIRYAMFPETHKNGAIHFHCLVDSQLEKYLFDFEGKALNNWYIRKSLSEGKEVKDCKAIGVMFGYNIAEPIRDVDACVQYVTKYVLKSYDDPNFIRLFRRRFFFSTGLKKPEVVLPPSDLQDFDLVFLSHYCPKFILKRHDKNNPRVILDSISPLRSTALSFSPLKE